MVTTRGLDAELIGRAGFALADALGFGGMERIQLPAALAGNPYDGHTLREIIEDTQKLAGREIERA